MLSHHFLKSKTISLTFFFASRIQKPKKSMLLKEKFANFLEEHFFNELKSTAEESKNDTGVAAPT